MALFNELYDAADTAMAMREQKKRQESAKKALAKQKVKQAAKQPGDSIVF